MRLKITSENGYFGEFGGCFVPEILQPAIKEIQEAYKNIFKSKNFQKELKFLLKNFVGRPTPLIHARNISKILNNNIYLKFEGLANTGAHKINNALAQVLLAKKMNKDFIIAETGAGQHGLAVASACAFLGMKCKIFMGEIDVARQRPNVFLMERMGASIVQVKSGTKTLKDAVNDALRFWSEKSSNTFYVIGSALGPHPYPDMVRDAQKIIGKEVKKQCKEQFGSLPDIIVACVGGGSNSLGIFTQFLNKKKVKLVGIEAGGDDFRDNRNAIRLSNILESRQKVVRQDYKNYARVGIAQGYKSIFLQDSEGNLGQTYSISAGLDYAGVGPQLAFLESVKRVSFRACSNQEALEALDFLAKNEGIIPALESAHALAGVLKISKEYRGKNIVVNISGRGDKDIFITAKELDAKNWLLFLQSQSMEIKDSKKLKYKHIGKYEFRKLDSKNAIFEQKRVKRPSKNDAKIKRYVEKPIENNLELKLSEIKKGGDNEKKDS